MRDIREWREELSRELTKLLEEQEHLEEARRHLDYASSQTNRPLKIRQKVALEQMYAQKLCLNKCTYQKVYSKISTYKSCI